jgi:hypothetical protein
MAGSDEDRCRSRRPGAEDRGWSSTGQVLGGQIVERSGGAMCCLTSKPRSVVSHDLVSKPVASGFLVEPQN